VVKRSIREDEWKRTRPSPGNRGMGRASRAPGPAPRGWSPRATILATPAAPTVGARTGVEGRPPTTPGRADATGGSRAWRPGPRAHEIARKHAIWGGFGAVLGRFPTPVTSVTTPRAHRSHVIFSKRLNFFKSNIRNGLHEENRGRPKWCVQKFAKLRHTVSSQGRKKRRNVKGDPGAERTLLHATNRDSPPRRTWRSGD
jgi:hypothetical protein